MTIYLMSTFSILLALSLRMSADSFTISLLSIFSIQIFFTIAIIRQLSSTQQSYSDKSSLSEYPLQWKSTSSNYDAH
ncbi:hypothetical protein FGO68_gene17621 [Halteria grandinella]|uniref:Uncharacterized protein n=1 Tax=Halteria grandinella TaxID=5974 RepID=A0A8J8NK22_HALGN|nr:hypothetical protein FGO68_gene17621 [Halteria grandinella]